jgi:glycosyltransferase involved in cell wall biosynthesis
MKFDIVIPVLNEEKTIKQNIAKVVSYLREIQTKDQSFRIVIADNGSTDRTPVLSSELTRNHPDMVFFERVDRPGVGLALKHAWLKSDADVVGYMDLDLATDLNHIAQVADSFLIDGSDLVYGSRLASGAKVVGRKFIREVSSRTFNFILKKYLSVSISDGMCGFKFLRRSLLDGLIKGGANSDGWFFCAALLVVADWKGYKLVELPIIWTDDPNSKVKLLKLTTKYLQEMKVLRRFKHGASI